MQNLIENIFIELVSNLFLLALAGFSIYVLARFLNRLKRSKLITFFRLNPDTPELTIYLSRHQSVAKVLRIPTSRTTPKVSLAIERLSQIQQEEGNTPTDAGLDVKDFTTISAIEMIEALRLKDDLQSPSFYDWLPKDIKESIYSNSSSLKKIHINIEVCPSPDDYQVLQKNGTMIFIGGPRANLGAYYYLYGEKAGRVRSRRMTSEKDIIEIIDTDELIKCPPDRNLAIIQRCTLKNQTLFYLSGTGVNGTAAAVEYLRIHWQDLSKNNSDFSLVLECDRRSDDNLTTYLKKKWTDDDWRLRKRLP